MNTAKRQALVEKVERMRRGNEPTIRPMQYNSDLIGALNYYNANEDSKTKKKWVVTYATKVLKDKDLATEIAEVDEFHFIQLAAIIRLKERDEHLEEKELNFITKKLAELRVIGRAALEERKNKPKTTIVSAPVVSVQDRIVEMSHKHAAEVDGAIDDACTSKDFSFSVKGYLAANNVSAPVSKLMAGFYKPLLSELEETLEGKDKQLVEGYSNFKKTELKKFAAMVKGIITDCEQQVVSAKSARKPRTVKQKPASVLVNKVRYQKEFSELNLKSIDPKTIIGASELWVYNTKYRRLTQYVADGVFGVRGTTLLNYDVAKSVTKTLRKPEEFFNTTNLAKKTLATALKAIKTKAAQPNGRLNEETILLKVF